MMDVACCSFLPQQWASESRYLADADLISGAYLSAEGTITCLLRAIVGDNIKPELLEVLLHIV